jgi:ATP-dependent protease HslVU (ClpYQ) peptidase subunit
LADIGIRLNVTETASQVGPRVNDVLRGIGATGEAVGEQIQKSFDMTQIEGQFSKFAKQVEQLHEVKYGKEKELKIRAMELRNEAMERKANEVEKNAAIKDKTGAYGVQNAGGVINRAGNNIASLGSTGNLMEPGTDVMTQIGSSVSKAGATGMVIGGVISAFAGIGIVVDTLSKQYEQFIPTLMDTSAAMGDLGKSSKENSLALQQNLNKASNAAGKFGYTLEESMNMYSAISKGGLSSTESNNRVLNAMSYGRGFGVNPNNLMGTQILAGRYNQGNVLGMTAGGLSASGMEAGRFEEYLTAMTGTFESALSSGIVKGFGEISQTMNFFSGIGETWKGQLGANRINQLSGSVSSATGLQKETDVLMYRAAQSLPKGKGDYINTMLELEKGMTPEMFMAFGKQAEMTTGGGRTDMVEMFKEAFNSNYRTAVDLVDAYMNDALTPSLLEKAAPTADSPEMQLASEQNALRLQVIELGKSLLNTKLGIVFAAGDVVSAIDKWIGIDIKEQEKNLNREIKLKEITEKITPFNADIRDKMTMVDEKGNPVSTSDLLKGMSEKITGSKSGKSTGSKTDNIKNKSMSMEFIGVVGLEGATVDPKFATKNDTVKIETVNLIKAIENNTKALLSPTTITTYDNTPIQIGGRK